MDNAKLVMASILIDRANRDLEKAGGDSDSFLFSKTDFNDSLRMARKLLLESYVDQRYAMDEYKLKQAVALLDRANYELKESFENDGMDEYDYEDAIILSRDLISKARELVIDVNEE